MLEAFVYVFISLNFPNYPEVGLFLVSRQGIAGLNISLSKNILTEINGKNRTGTFCCILLTCGRAAASFRVSFLGPPVA